ncbi:striated muscle preferentially expressed protein kinase-like isoform X3 [Engraulis encrasicolus]|uniref:striated muscle preferentially expressed protein kinase-like isoform X3 n=1 Tax=Engraulis encrasicolus TaxID=184585 RepID=UPI002FD4ED74
MKKIWSKKRFQKTGHSNRTFGRFTHDSENTEDEAGESQVPMETKERAKGGHGHTGNKMGDRSKVDPYGQRDPRGHIQSQEQVVGREVLPLGSRPPHLSDHAHPGRTQVDSQTKALTPSVQSSLDKTQKSSTPTSPIGGATEPGPEAALPSSSSGVQTQQKKPGGSPGTKREEVNGKTAKASKASSVSSQCSDPPDRDTALPGQTPKLARAGSRIFDKVRAFEERRNSVDPVPRGSTSARSWAGFGRAASVDSDERGKHGGATPKDKTMSDVAAKRSFFKQKASSLEEGSSGGGHSSYAQKVQNFQNKFTEELHRIKRLVGGKQGMKKAMSTEQLTQTDMLSPSLHKLEPIPPEVVQKLQGLETKPETKAVEFEKKEQSPVLNTARTQNSLKGGEEEKSKTLKAANLAASEGPKTQPAKNSDLASAAEQKMQAGRDTLVTKPETDGASSAKTRILPTIKLPGQCSPRLPRKSPTRQSPTTPPSTPQTPQEITPRNCPTSPPSVLQTPQETTQTNQEAEQPIPKKERKSTSPHLERASPTKAVAPPKPPRLGTAGPVQISQQAKRGPSPGLKLTIPTIVVGDKLMEEDEEEEGEKMECDEKRTRKPGRRTKSERRKKHRPTSPEQDDSSDDSYMSAEEEGEMKGKMREEERGKEGMMETETGRGGAPHFQSPLRDAEACAGDTVTLTCVIAGSPLPRVRWQKGETEIQDGPTHTLRAEGTKHTLTITQMAPSDAGTYRLTATNNTGQAQSSATLFIRAEPVQVPHGKLSLPLEPLGSPAPSDEEYLSPLEEAVEMDISWSRRTEASPFKEPPSFQVSPADQAVTEGQEVTMAVQVCGQPKPMVYWLRDRVAVKTDSRHVVQELPDGKFEMKIKSALKSDGGVYTCKIINEYGVKQADCKLEVSALVATPVLAVTTPLTDVSVRAGDTAIFECHMTGPQEVDVDWLANGKLIQPALLDCKMQFDGKRCRLLMHAVHEDDSGTYTCKLSSAKEELVSTARLKVTPSREPLFTRKLEVLEVTEGRSARFDCKISGSPTPQVTWSHLESPLEESDNIHFLCEGGRHSLLISQVTQEHEGFYSATAHNPHGDAECSAELYVQEPRPAISSHMAKLEKMPSIPEEPEVLDPEVERRTMPDFLSPLQDVEVVEGKEAVLKCRVLGMPYPTITWYHNGTKIDSTDDRKMTQYRDVHSLVIRSVCHAHSGVYKSVISNKVGKAACYAHLYVTDILPEPPDGAPVIDSITGRTITLSWNQPKNLDPSLDPSSLLYAVQQQALGSIQWNIIASNLRETTYTVSSLCKGARYAFRVLASTGRAFSKPSPPTDLVQLIDRGQYMRKGPEILDKPETVFAVENQPATLTVTLNHVQATVTWKRRGVILVHKPGMHEMSMPDDDQHTLRLARVRPGDNGQYTCIVSNAFGSDICHVQLAISEPPVFESIMEDLDVCVGETTRLVVVVDGKPDPDILWYKDNALLSESSHFTFVYDDRECSLVVLNAREEDSGVYTCTAKNLAGSVSCKAELTVRVAKVVIEEPMEDEETILRRMRRLTDYYDIHKEIGRGAFSYVRRVTLKAAKRDYAAKHITARGKRKEAALREMALLSELDHDRILYFHDAFEKKNMIVIITELCHEELLERITKKTSILEGEVRSTIRQLLEGIDYLHYNNIIHLDIKPENILMADRNSDQIRICDFGNAVKLTEGELQYCAYGTPEFVAPEFVSQTPVSKSTDIWPVGVITYLCLTGVSPFAAENDRETLLNIRNYNVAFEEGMFAELCREAKGFVIKLLVLDRLRPDTTECLRHPWFKTLTKGKSISTVLHKQVQARRKWQKSLINYKSKMVMRAIPELLDDSAKHTSIAVSKHLRGSSPAASSSSDSDEDIDELPFIPMPLNMVFSGSRMSLNEITGDEEAPDIATLVKANNHNREEAMECDAESGTGKTQESDEEVKDGGEKTRKPLQRGSSVEEEEARIKSRRATMRRGSSADSALLLHISPEEGAETTGEAEDSSGVSLKKAVSMELPRRTPSPGPGKLSQEDYALKLELMRQRLLRGGTADKKMSGLRGPLLETLGVDDERRTSSLDRNLRRTRMGAGGMTRAASTENPGEGSPKMKVFRKSASFSDPESTPLHRRSGAPLEIPNTGHMGDQKLHEAMSMSVLAEPTKVNSRSESPTDSNLSTSVSDIVELQGKKQEIKWIVGKEEMDDDEQDETTVSELSSQTPEEDSVSLSSQSVLKDTISVDSSVLGGENSSRRGSMVDRSETVSISTESELKMEVDSTASTPTEKKGSAYAEVMQTIMGLQPNGRQTPSTNGRTTPTAQLTHSRTRSNPETILAPEHPAVFARVATLSPLRTDIKDIDSEEVFEARFKKRESSLTRGLKRLTRAKSEEKSPSMPRKLGEDIYRPGPTGAPLELVARGLQEKSKSVQDLREGDKELGLIGRFSMRSKKSSLVTKKEEKPKGESPKDEATSKRRVSWAMGRSKSLDKKVLETTDQELEAKKEMADKEDKKVGESPVLAMRRRFESKVAGISEKIRSKSEERKELKTQKDAERADASVEEGKPDQKKIGESPVLAMRKKFEAKVAGISMKMRSQSEDREQETEPKPEGKKTPLLSRLRHSQSEGTSLKKMDIPENQLEEQTGKFGGNESVESTNSAQVDLKSTPETDRRSRWDRWGLSRSKRGKSPAQVTPAAPVSKEEEAKGKEYTRSPSDYPPVFHIKLKDHILLEGDPVTMSCLPAASPFPKITWMKDKSPLVIDGRMTLMGSPDGRQHLMILNTTSKDAGLYECVASNPLATSTSSCTISLACVPKRPGTPEVPQTYKNTALVMWKPADTKPPCTYSLERRTEGETTWLIVSTGLVDCYHNATELPVGSTLRFRVACVNKAGQGPYSNISDKVAVNTTGSELSRPAMGKASSPPPPASPPPSSDAAMATASSAVQHSKSVPTVCLPPAAAASPPPTLPKPQAQARAITPAPLLSVHMPGQVYQRSTSAPLTTTPEVPLAPSKTSSKVPVTPSPAPVPTSIVPVTPSSPPATVPAVTRTPRVWPPRSRAEAQSPQPDPPLGQRQTTASAVQTIIKSIPPLVAPKPTSPVNIVPPITQMTPPVPSVSCQSPHTAAPALTGLTSSSSSPSTSSPSVPVPLPGRVMSPVPSYPPPSATSPVPFPSAPMPPSHLPLSTARVAPTPISPVVLVSSMSPIGEGATSPTPGSPVTSPGGHRGAPVKSGEAGLRQGVPQKPYTFLEEKIRGRFGVIRECRENATGKMFMAKIVSYEPETKQQAVAEYHTLKSLHNERIMALHEAYVTPRYLVLITENCAGKELLYSLSDRFRYSEDDVVQYLVGVLQGLEYLHSRRYLHLDIKPDNVMVTPLNTVKLVDLGSAQSFNPLQLRSYSRDLATLEYSAPELLKGDVVGPPVDMWGVGVLVYIMLSGRLPFQDKDPTLTESKIVAAKFDATKLYPNVSQTASGFLKKALHGYPWSRPSMKDCFSHMWLQDSYLMKLRRQTLTFTTARLKEHLGEQQRRRTENTTKHKIMLRAYQSTAQ